MKSNWMDKSMSEEIQNKERRKTLNRNQSKNILMWKSYAKITVQMLSLSL